MDLLHQRNSSFFQTHFTERVLSCISISDAFPGASISFIYVWASLIPVVLLSGNLLVLWAVLLVGQVGAPRVRARVLRLFWHGDRPS